MLRVVKDGERDRIVNAAFDAVEEVGEKDDIAATMAVSAMIFCMNDERNSIAKRSRAIRVIGSIGEKRPHLDAIKSAISALIETLDDRSPELLQSALWALGQIGNQSPELVAPAVPKISRIAREHKVEELNSDVSLQENAMPGTSKTTSKDLLIVGVALLVVGLIPGRSKSTDEETGGK